MLKLGTGQLQKTDTKYAEEWPCLTFSTSVHFNSCQQRCHSFRIASIEWTRQTQQVDIVRGEYSYHLNYKSLETGSLFASFFNLQFVVYSFQQSVFQNVLKREKDYSFVMHKIQCQHSIILNTTRIDTAMAKHWQSDNGPNTEAYMKYSNFSLSL